MSSQSSNEQGGLGIGGCFWFLWWCVILPAINVSNRNSSASVLQWIVGVAGWGLAIFIAYLGAEFLPSRRGCLTGLILIIVAAVLGIGTDGFVASGDFTATFNSIRQSISPAPTQVAEATVLPETQTEVAQEPTLTTVLSEATVTQVTEGAGNSTEAPTPVHPTSEPTLITGTPVPLSTTTLMPTSDPIVQNINNVVTALGSVGADVSTAQPLSPEVETWRRPMLFILIVQFLVASLINRRQKRQKTGQLIFTLIGIGLSFTRLGQLTYQIMMWFFSLGLIGQIIVVVFGCLRGRFGYGSISAFLIGAYLYHDLQVLQLCVLPSMIVGFIFLLYFVFKRGGRVTDIEVINDKRK